MRWVAGILTWIRDAIGASWRWFLPLIAGLTGILVGILLFTFGYAGGMNYFGHEPQTCNQCHAMNGQYDRWSRGSHAGVATCQDCHSPHDNPVYYWVNKADNGFWHALKFTTGDYPENMHIRDHNRQIAEESCLMCHDTLTHDIRALRATDQQVDCLQCHAGVGHGRD